MRQWLSFREHSRRCNAPDHDLNNVLNGSLNNLLAASTINILSGLVITAPITI